VNRLTKREQLVLCLVVGLLLTGWAVKAYRTAHPPASRVSQESNRSERPPVTSSERAEE
jgi:hypothetical protein